MTRPRSVLGALLLCALCICAFGAANASATTLYVCQEVEKGGKWEDSKCEKANEKGKFATVAVAQGTATEVVGTGTGAATIQTNVTGFLVTVQCEKQSTTQLATNELVGGVMQNVGKEISINFTGCTVPAPKEQNCKVKEGTVKFNIGSSTTFMKTEAETRVEFVPPGGGPLAEFTLEGCKTMPNMTLAVSGRLIGIPSGSSLVFNKETSAEGTISLGGFSTTVEATLLVTAMEKRTMLE